MHLQEVVIVVSDGNMILLLCNLYRVTCFAPEDGADIEKGLVGNLDVSLVIWARLHHQGAFHAHLLELIDKPDLMSSGLLCCLAAMIDFLFVSAAPLAPN